ncbi:isocitrate lyase/phosphoenolpyruvate mutase family protein [Asticcacaulis sp.]|uniref:isocitrate lyase/PEP mutase family protein n=1 Tax=Asticcacaulis sp. TaxID=1872648 RepID=UPI002C3E6863|nr:isocitrate lyase/phosphoenolpyruvate mutase family protein [Asticcacaulis sp.]HTM82130.1 isocitrate lyase/phosphoenolpyruvate mutase family protein [Asticcacaulis sp.]
MKSQAQKAADFAALHERGCFVIPNPWDRGTARLLAGLGFRALTTTSAGYARALGVSDYRAGREHVLAHVRDLASATDLPLAADLENGFGHSPEDCAETIRLGAEAGLVGGSIEDFTGDEQVIYDLAEAADRIRAAAEAAKALPFKFMLVARCENYLRGRPDLADTLARLQAYQDAGADVLYAPGVSTAEEIREICRGVDRPVNVLGGLGVKPLSVCELAELGVRRVSLGSWLHSAAMTAFVNAAQDESFGYVADLVGGAQLDQWLVEGAG